MSQDAYPSLPAVDIAALHEAIKADLRTGFPTNGAGAVPTVDYYGRQGERINVPAIFFELTAIVPGDPSDDIGTEQFNARLEFSAYVLVSYKDTDIKAKLAVRALVARVLARIKGNRWGQTATFTKAEVTGAFPDQFNAGPGGQGSGVQHSYETWRIDWTHDALIDVSVWDPSGAVPTEVWVGIDPDTGPANVLRYRRMVPDAAETDAARAGAGTAGSAGGAVAADAEVTIPAT